MAEEKSKSYQNWLIESLTDREEAIAYLTAAIEDGDQEVLLIAIKNVCKAKGFLAIENFVCWMNGEGKAEFEELNELIKEAGSRYHARMTLKSALKKEKNER